MKYRNRFTGGIIEASVHVGDYADLWKGDVCLGVSDGDRIFRLPDGAWEKAPADHPMWADYDEIVETRVVKIEDDAGTRYAPERLTGTGWVRGAEKATQKAAEAAVVSAPVVTVVKAFEGGEVKAELVAGDNPDTPEVETSWWKKVMDFVGLGD